MIPRRFSDLPEYAFPRLRALLERHSPGGEPLAENGWLPDYTSLPEELLARTAFAFYCSPSNPQGAVASREQLGRLAALAENYDFIIGFDECYSEIYPDPDSPPPGGLEAAVAEGVSLDHVLVFNSLSKRSNVPGLRSGFVAGGAAPIEAMKRLRAYAGAPSPLPVLHTAEALWRDEAHVVENRALYREKFALVDEVLGGLPGYTAPKGGFFLWLEVDDGEAVTVDLWRKHGVGVLPGAYLGRGDPRFIDGMNPGTRFIRAALVEPAETLRPGLEAIADVLRAQTRHPVEVTA